MRGDDDDDDDDDDDVGGGGRVVEGGGGEYQKMTRSLPFEINAVESTGLNLTHV